MKCRVSLSFTDEAGEAGVIRKPTSRRSLPIEQSAERLREISEIDAGIGAKRVADLLQLFIGGEGQIDEEPLAPAEFTRAAAASSQPFVPDAIAQFLGDRQRLFEQFYGSHPAFRS